MQMDRFRKLVPASIGLFLAIACMILSNTVSMSAQASPKQIAVAPPPMGWSSWNAFSNTVNSQVIVDQAKAMASNGMSKLGYRYINIDEGWWLGDRDAEGNIVVDPKAWPAIAAGERAGDMSNIVRYIHGLGLKAGIYTDAGLNGCGTFFPDLGPGYPHEGSEGHYEQDFLQFAKWGFDYVKVDWCGGDKENLDPAVQYAEVARAIERAEAITGQRLFFSICEWGKNSPSTWAAGVGGIPGDIWRTGGDIVAPIVADTKNADRKAELKEVFREFDQAVHPEAQHSGFYNDPDMMVVGMPGLTEEQNRVHMSLWAVLGGPLLVGADLSRLSEESLATLKNPEAIAIDQDPRGLQAFKVASPGNGLEVWSKPLSASGSRAVLLLNRTAVAAPIPVRSADLGLLDSSSAKIHDVWADKDLGAFNDSSPITVPAEDMVLLVVKGSEAPQAKYGDHSAAVERNHTVTFKNVASHAPVAPIAISYVNPDKAPRFAELRVNGRIATKIAFPYTGSTAPGTLWIESLLDRDGAKNVLEFSTEGDPGPTIYSISLQ
jgi:hypothetical protein